MCRLRAATNARLHEREMEHSHRTISSHTHEESVRKKGVEVRTVTSVESRDWKMHRVPTVGRYQLPLSATAVGKQIPTRLCSTRQCFRPTLGRERCVIGGKNGSQLLTEYPGTISH